MPVPVLPMLGAYAAGTIGGKIINRKLEKDKEDKKKKNNMMGSNAKRARRKGVSAAKKFKNKYGKGKYAQ